jgi:curved DNA-binding protein
MLRLRGKGVTKKGRPDGDLYVHFLVQTPTDASPEVGKLVDELAKHQPDDPRADIRL